MNKLAELRRNKKMSQREVAAALNISQSTLSQYERGGRSIDDAMLKKLCVYYNVSADEILGIEASFTTITSNKSLPKDSAELLNLFSKMDDKFKLRLLGAAYAILAEQSVDAKLNLGKVRTSAK